MNPTKNFKDMLAFVAQQTGEDETARLEKAFADEYTRGRQDEAKTCEGCSNTKLEAVLAEVREVNIYDWNSQTQRMIKVKVEAIINKAIKS